MLKKIKFKPIQILFIFIGLNLLVGILIAPDFGRSTDESFEASRAQVALDIYTGEIKINPDENYEQLGHTRFYGTASSSLIAFIEQYIFPNINHSTKTIAHYTYFVFFQIAIIGIYLLSRHFFDKWVSLSVAILFGTQPLLFGHAFINPKDIPLLSLFLITVVLGFSMVDGWSKEQNIESSQENNTKQQIPVKNKQIIIFSIVFLSLLLFFTNGPGITKYSLQIIEYSFNSNGEGIMGKLFVATTQGGELQDYITDFKLLLLQAYRNLFFFTPFILLFMFHQSKKKGIFVHHIDLKLLFAAGIWGIAISTRVLSIAAGGIVGLYALMKYGKKVVFPLIVYTMTAILVSALTWPLIWVYGIKGYVDSLILNNNFPWFTKVLFEGKAFYPTELPSRYLPKLMMLQFTEPMVILILLGLVISIYILIKKKDNWLKLLLLFAWFFLPVFYIIFGHSPIYTNFRHFLFILPPLFIISGFFLQFISSKIRNKAIFLFLTIALCVPGIKSMTKIHPYEYIYYNSFTGGVEGAYGLYSLDYWATSYKDAMDYVNENIPPESRIMVWKNNLSGKYYATNDYFFIAHTEVAEEDYDTFDYFIMPSGGKNNDPYFSTLPSVFTVKVDNVSLLEVIKIN